MKKWVIALLLVLLAVSSVPASAKWRVHEAVNFHGQMGALEMELETLDIDLSDEKLYPGWNKDIPLTVSNTGTVPFILEAELQDVPDFLTVRVEMPIGTVAAGADAQVTLHCSVNVDETDNMGADTSFALKLTARQE